MSVVNKVPLIEQLIGEAVGMDPDTNPAVLVDIINSKNYKVFKVINEEINFNTLQDVELAVVQFKDQEPVKGILFNIYAWGYKAYVVDVFNGDVVNIYGITENNKVEKIDEPCSLVEVRAYLGLLVGAGGGGSSGGTKLYKHKVTILNEDDGFRRYVQIISTQPTAYNNPVAIAQQCGAVNTDYRIIFAAMTENIDEYGESFLYFARSVTASGIVLEFSNNKSVNPGTTIYNDEVTEL